MVWEQRRVLFRTCIYVIVSMMLSGIVAADSTEYNVKAAYLYHLTKFTQWPYSRSTNVNAAMRICVLGTNPFGQVLDKLSGRTSQNRSIEVEYLTSSQEFSHCDVIYISKSKEKSLKQILQKMEHLPVLTVSDMDSFARQGGMIGFVIERGKVRLEVNNKASQLSDIKLSSKLLAIATIIDGE